MTAGTKHTPMRRCVVCRQSRPKGELLRWVRSSDGIAFDSSGKSAGRGAYICPTASCLRTALTRKGVERVLGGRPAESQVESLLAIHGGPRADDCPPAAPGRRVA